MASVPKDLPQDQLNLEVSHLSRRVAALEERLVASSTVTLYIETFAPEPYSLKRPVPVVIQNREGSFVASFADAGVHSSGETQQEAYENAKELILDIFDQLKSVPASRLGPGPARQLAVLREYLDGPNHEGARGEDRQETERRGDSQAQGA